MPRHTLARAALALALAAAARAQPDVDAVAVEPASAADGCAFAPPDALSVGLQAGAVISIFAVSLICAALPILLARCQTRGADATLRVLGYLGGGVILATAFIHLLLPAQETLRSECLSAGWLAAYPDFALLFCLVTIAAMLVLDFFVERALLRRGGPGAGAEGAEGADLEAAAKGAPAPTPAPGAHVCAHSLPVDAAGRVRLAGLGLSEFSIGLHSVLVGIALGVADADEYVPLWVALVFHQGLEGIALGSLAQAAGLRARSVAALALAYALTTPAGMAIGLGARASLDPDAQATLLAFGTLDAVAAGLLIHLALGDHLCAVKSGAAWLRARGPGLVATCICAFLAGVGVMAYIGVWA
jgi:zinc transporter 1/2/3